MPDNIDIDSETESDQVDNDGETFSTETVAAPKVAIMHAALQPLVLKLRTVVTLFKRSPTKNDDVLQPYIKKDFKKEVLLKLDCKTRWSSLCEMLETFYKVRMCVKMALIDLKIGIDFTEQKFELMENTISALLSVKLTVEALCRRDSNLISADAAIQFMFEELAGIDGEICQALKTQLVKRVNQRRTEKSSVLQYLHGQKNTIDFEFDLATKSTVIAFVVRPYQRLHRKSAPTNADDDDSDDSIAKIVNRKLKSMTISRVLLTPMPKPRTKWFP